MVPLSRETRDAMSDDRTIEIFFTHEVEGYAEDFPRLRSIDRAIVGHGRPVSPGSAGP